MTNQRCKSVPLRTLMTMLVAMLFMLASGCKVTDPQYRREKSARHSPRVNLDLQPGQLIEAVIVEPARTIKQRRVRAEIQSDGQIALDTLGRFDTRGRSLTQLEQDMLNHLNKGRRLLGTLRLTLVETDAAPPPPQ